MHSSKDGRTAVGDIDQQLMKRLRSLVGRECAFLGKHCRVIDILGDEGMLVLESREDPPPIQTDQYGQARSRSNQLLQVPILGKDKTSFSEEIMDLFTAMGRP